MSRYEWERGEFIIPSSEWAGVKAAIRDAVNKSNAEMYDAAVKLHARLGPKLKGVKQHGWEDVAHKEMEALNPQSGYYGARKLTDSQCFEVVQKVIPSQWDPTTRTSKRRFKKPQKKDFPQLGNNVTAFEDAGGECSVSFDNATRTMSWRVSENNHAVDQARESRLGKAMFAALGKVKWTRGTGGTIRGNDEYNRESDHEGGGANYAKESFGPDVKKPEPSFRGAVTAFRRW